MQLDILFNVSIILLLVSNFILPRDLENKRMIFVLFAFLSLALYVLLGEYINNSDTAVYYQNFLKYTQIPFDTFLEQHISKSPSYFVSCYIFGKIIPIPELWVYFIILSYLFVVSYVIYKESKNPYLSFLLFIILGFFGFCLIGLKQELAMIFTMFAYFMLLKRKLVLFILLVLIAASFHLSALVFLLIYPIAYKKFSWIHIVVVFVVLGFFIFGQSNFRFLIQYIFRDQYLSGYSDRTATLSYVTFLMQLILFIFYMIVYKKTIEKEPKSIVLYNLCFLGLVFQLYASIIAEMFRVSYYFSFYNLLLLPIVIENFSNNETTKKTVNITITLLFVVFILLKYIFKLFL